MVKLKDIWRSNKGRNIIMNINKKLDGGKLIIEIEGRLDTSTAPQLE